jgi:hypothetical protein
LNRNPKQYHVYIFGLSEGKESLQFEFHRKYEKSKYSSAAGLPASEK